MQVRSIRAFAALSISLVLTGCANKEQIIPQPEMSMQEIYESENARSTGNVINEGRSALRRPLNQLETDLSPYVRSESDHLKSRFQLLPNPTLYMFVAPHLSTRDRVPVPGYLTEFKMYEREEYALPGEAVNWN